MIGDQLKPTPQPPRYSDPEEPLAGKCASCGAVIQCLRMDARPPSGKPEPGVWGDLPCAECPACGAKTFLMPAADFRAVAARAGGPNLG